MKRLILVAGLIALAMPASAQTRGSKTPKFVETAAISDMFEIQSSQAALEKASRDDVKQFAQHMIDDHTKVSSDMKALLSKAGVNAQVPTDLDKKHAQQLTKMQGLTGVKFEAAYIAAQVKGHQDAVRLYQSYSQSGDNTELKDFASATLPNLQEHLKEAQSLKSGKAGRAKTSMR